MSTNPQLRAELLAMEAEDQRVHTELARAGEFGQQAYHPRMRAVHRTNSARLREIIAAHGWPGRSLVDEDGAKAAWFILQHSISEPDFMRGCVALLEKSVAAEEAPAWHLAYVTDRISFYEGRPQRYGSQWNVEDDGTTVLWDLESPENVDELRKSVDLKPWSDTFTPERWQEILARRPSEKLQHDFEQWIREIGWRK